VTRHHVGARSEKGAMSHRLYAGTATESSTYSFAINQLQVLDTLETFSSRGTRQAPSRVSSMSERLGTKTCPPNVSSYRSCTGLHTATKKSGHCLLMILLQIILFGKFISRKQQGRSMPCQGSNESFVMYRVSGIIVYLLLTLFAVVESKADRQQTVKTGEHIKRPGPQIHVRVEWRHLAGCLPSSSFYGCQMLQEKGEGS
jgi:hypothetical protein